MINEAVTDSLPLLQDRSDLLILHITGRYTGPDYNAPRDTERRIVQLGLEGDISRWYRRFDYMEEIQDAYAAADLVVCRGGASTLTEICICGLPALIVPLATASEDHQALNARELERSGAARVIYQEAFWSDGGVRSGVDGRRLAGEILEILDAPQKRRAMAAAASSVPLKNSPATDAGRNREDGPGPEDLFPSAWSSPFLQMTCPEIQTHFWAGFGSASRKQGASIIWSMRSGSTGATRPTASWSTMDGTRSLWDAATSG